MEKEIKDILKAFKTIDKLIGKAPAELEKKLRKAEKAAKSLQKHIENNRHDDAAAAAAAAANNNNAAAANNNNAAAADSCRFVAAPMVGASELAFRLLCRKYGASLCYTPMILADKFVGDKGFRSAEIAANSHPLDHPLVYHFGGNNVANLVQAAKYVEAVCEAVDVNLGCPQRAAYSGHYGSFLLGENESDRSLIINIVSTLKKSVRVPVFVKIRLLETIEQTVRLCTQLADAGASLIAVHARYRVNVEAGEKPRDGPAYLDQVTEIRKRIRRDVLIVANGNVVESEDVVNNMKSTGADGIMSAEGLLDNPALFAKLYRPPLSSSLPLPLPSLGVSASNWEEEEEERKEIPLAKGNLELAIEYLELSKLHPVPMKSRVFHTRRMCKKELNQYQLMEECLGCESVERLEEVVKKAMRYRDDPRAFEFNEEKERENREIAEQRRREEKKRKEFEDRMRRKAKREGKEDLDFYLSIGKECPTVEELQQFKLSLSNNSNNNSNNNNSAREKAMEIWKAKHSQHCFEFHLGAAGCHRLVCPFLHIQPTFVDARPETFG